MKEINIRFVLTILLILLLLNFYFNYKAHERIEEIDNSIYKLQMEKFFALTWFNELENKSYSFTGVMCQFVVDFRFVERCQKDVKEYLNETKQVD